MGTKLSAIASGGAVAGATDKTVAVRSGTTDVLVTPVALDAIQTFSAAQAFSVSISAAKIYGSNASGCYMYQRSAAPDLITFSSAVPHDFAELTTGGGFALASNLMFVWNSSSTTANGGLDTGLGRNAAGVVEVNNATLGTLSDIAFRWARNNGGRARLRNDATATDTTFVSLADLTLTLLAGRKYTGRLVIKCNNTTAAEGIKFDFNGGAATMTSFWAGGGILASGGTDVLGTNVSTSLAGVINWTTITGETIIVLEISLVVNAAGTFIPRFAENSTAAGTATVELGSNLWLDDSPN